MNIAHAAVLCAALLPYLFVLYAKSDRRYLAEGHSDPRAWAESIAGAKRRAYNAQLNGFEAFPPFAAGVLLAEHTGVSQGLVDALAVAFVVLRLIHGVLYIADRPALRAMAWYAGLGCTAALLGLSI